MSIYEERNAIITGATLSNDDHGLLSSFVTLDYGGSGQGFGGYALYLPDDFSHSNNQRNYAGHWIWRVMQIAEVSEWGKLKGRPVRARAEHSKVHAIGHFIRDEWFYPAEEFKKLERLPDSAGVKPK